MSFRPLLAAAVVVTAAGCGGGGHPRVNGGSPSSRLVVKVEHANAKVEGSSIVGT